jgi:hypothetical protein
LASQLRFEGPDLEALLERIRSELGADAHILAANRIRKGGVGGFFSREAFEVIVEGSAAPLPRPPREQQPLDIGLDVEDLRMPPPMSARRRVPSSVLDLAEDINADERRQVIDLSDAPVSTERQDFGSMLANLTRELDEEEAEMPLPPPTVSRRQAPMITIPEEEDPVAPISHYRRVTPPPTPAMPRPPVPSVAPGLMDTSVLPELAPVPDARLHALGLPTELTPTNVAWMDIRTALVQRLAQLPPPPMLPRSAGVLIAVVGIGTAPIALSRKLADELDVESEHIVLATPEPVSELSHPDQAEAFRLSCRRREEPTIVACSIGPGRAQLGWAHRMLDRLEPTITWAVIDASCKPEDVDHRVKLLGGVDVLAVTGITDTVSPAALLQLQIPVGRIGASPATPAAWADLLMDRLER